ncbi:hypothetical protein RJ639_030270 [Escallonia herrerae]|uniref:Retrotransposon Copia-like N-terminal domain-containing protein n=1 Tax=Escallonia herrerae TaxID=1293975 RepID=A0AA89BDW2_9ASTE|nr:hypothetical protein RJ639_030270 [Escallonia herrerae]
MEDESTSYVHGGLAPVANVQNIAIDTKSPFYLHPSDHPGLIFVTQPLSENGENYFTWRRNMLTALQSKNKAGFVDGLIAKPDVHSRDFQSWIQCNAVVKSWIVNSLSRELQTSAAHADTASEIWCDFDERFTQGIALRVYDLKRSIALLQQEKSAISTYYGKLKGVWNELHNLRPIPVCTCGAGKKMEEMREEEKVFDFLMGLDDTYKTVRSQILSIDPLPGLGRAYAVAAQEEKQQVVAAARVPTIEATTLLAKAPHMRHGGDQKIDRRGENSGERRHGGLHCTQCNRSNHSRENCYEIIGYPPGWRRPKPRGGNQPWLRASGGTQHHRRQLPSHLQLLPTHPHHFQITALHINHGRALPETQHQRQRFHNNSLPHPTNLCHFQASHPVKCKDLLIFWAANQDPLMGLLQI